MFEELKKNLLLEKKIVADISSVQFGLQSDSGNRNLYLSSIDALKRQLILLNDTIPELLKMPNSEDEKKKLESEKKKVEPEKKKEIGGVESVSYSQGVNSKGKTFVTINKKDKKEFMEKLKFSEGALTKIKEIKKKSSGEVLVKPSAYVIISNKFFRKTSDKLSPQFVSLGKDLKKSNSRYMLTSYLSMAIMSVMLSFIFGMIVFGIFMVIDLSNWKYVAAPFGLSGLVLAMFYMYPSGEANSVQKLISQELPFVAIHMSAIAGSNIEPVKIFKIIAGSEEYVNVAKEIRKVIAQIEIYGYDLVMASKNVAGRPSNQDLAELFSGLATNIATGGSLKNYLEGKADSFLVDYRLERQKYSELAGTFMDVYISILIAAPLILMMMFIVMNVAGLGMGGMGITTLLMLSILGIAVANVVFLIVLNAKQPKV